MKITCKQCKRSSRVRFKNDQYIEYIDTTPIISARKRKDLKWGFECLCGNDSRMCKLELARADELLKGSSKEVMQRVIDNMKVTDDDSFVMTEV